MQTWKTRSKAEVFKMGKWLSVEQHEVELPDGQVIGDWSWVITPDFINVLAVTPEGNVLVFRQGKYGLDGDSLAPVGGYIEPGEEPAAAARRELLEEMGCEADEWIDLGQFIVDPNRGVAMGTPFLALGARRVAEVVRDDLEEQELLEMSLDDLRTALLSGQIKVLAWIANISLALLYLDSRK